MSRSSKPSESLDLSTSGTKEDNSDNPSSSGVNDRQHDLRSLLFCCFILENSSTKSPSKSPFDTLCQAAKDILDTNSPDDYSSDVEHNYGLLDVSENDKSFILYLDCPGMKKEDIDIRIDGNKMIISGTREVEPVKEGCFFYSERSENSINREILLPAGILVDSITSCYKNGVLIVTIDKTPSDANRVIKKIPVNSILC